MPMAERRRKLEPTTFVLFGATGDLAKRKIYPALYNLFVRGKLPAAFSVIGLGRREWSDDTLRANVEQSLRQFSRTKPDDAATLGRFLQALRYFVLDIGRGCTADRAAKIGRHRRRTRKRSSNVPVGTSVDLRHRAAAVAAEGANALDGHHDQQNRHGRAGRGIEQ